VSYRVSNDSRNDKETHGIKSANRVIPAQILHSTLESPITYLAGVIITSNPASRMIPFIFLTALPYLDMYPTLTTTPLFFKSSHFV
jgi:hypothetical protein